MGRPRVRPDMALVEGYHSPQVSVRVRLNTNEAPVGPPDEFVRRFSEEVRSLAWHRYPDRSALALRERIAALEGVGSEQIFVANGSNEVLQTVMLTYAGFGRKVAVFEPTYALHSHLARISGAQVVGVDRSSDLRIEPDSAVALIERERPAVTMVCSPNNPTGIQEELETIHRVLAASEGVDGVLVVDEAYGQFAPRSAVALVAETRNVAVSRTFSKTWSMAGLRLGYLVAPAWMVDELDKVVLPYHLDAAKQLAGLLALDYEDEMRQRVAEIVEERGRVQVGLSRLSVDQWPSGANFILFRPREREASSVWKGLVERSVLVRNCAGWPGVEGCLRVTIGTPEENEEFLAALEEELS